MSPDAKGRLRTTERTVFKYYNDMAIHRNVHVVLNQAQFDALVSFTYNADADGSADTYALINRNDFKGAGANMRKFIKVRVKTKTGEKKVVAPGLVKRRTLESAPFMKPNASATAANSRDRRLTC